MLKTKLKNLTLIVFVFLAFFAVTAINTAYAQKTLNPPQPIVNVNFPCPSPGCQPITSDTQVTTYIQTFYQFSLWIGGALALGMIVAGGIVRILSAGSPDKIREANDMITSAIFGLLLLFGAYLVLNTINPQLTLLKLPAAGEASTEKAQLTEKLSDTNCVAPGVEDFANIPVWNGVKQISVLHCIYRQEVGHNPVSNGFGFVAGDYYAEDFAIPNGSMVWKYPYFTGTSPTATAKCLVYAYKEPGVGKTVQMTPLNSSLKLCTPLYQNLGGPVCKEWQFSARESKTKDFKNPDQFVTRTFTDKTFQRDPLSPPTVPSFARDYWGDNPIYYCINPDGSENKNTYCANENAAPFWTCTVAENPPSIQNKDTPIVSPCADCEDLPPNFSVNGNPCDKTIDNTTLNSHKGYCRLNKKFTADLDKFNKLMQAAKNSSGGTGISWQITEAWPNTVYHSSPCHYDGQCADIALTGNVTCADVQKTMDILKSSAGGGFFRSLNEYARPPLVCNAEGNYKTTTGNNIHVEW